MTEEEAIAAGRDPDLVVDAIWPDHIIEIDPDKSDELVWEWHAWDHLIQDFDEDQQNYGVVAEHPELININYGRTDEDWMHTNAIDYNEDLDQILLSVHGFSEIWIIDHRHATPKRAHRSGQER